MSKPKYAICSNCKKGNGHLLETPIVLLQQNTDNPEVPNRIEVGLSYSCFICHTVIKVITYPDPQTVSDILDDPADPAE